MGFDMEQSVKINFMPNSIKFWPFPMWKKAKLNFKIEFHPGDYYLKNAELNNKGRNAVVKV